MLPAFSLADWRPVPAVNLPNSITLTRIFSIPLLIWILSTNHFQRFSRGAGIAGVGAVHRGFHH